MCIKKPVLKIFNIEKLMKIDTNILNLAIKKYLGQKYISK